MNGTVLNGVSKPLNNDTKNTLKKIQECLIQICIRDKIFHSLEKLEFLENEGFYNQYPSNLFVQ